MYKKGIRILRAEVGLLSNRQELLEFRKMELADLETDFHKVEEIEFTPSLDGYLYIIDSPEEPRLQISPPRIVATGHFLRLHQRMKDPRFSILGNEGLLYRFILRTLEEKHAIFNLHACALWDDKREILHIVCGGAGSGKTAYILGGLEKGFGLFTTETCHFRMEKGKPVFFKGSLLDNVRIGNLKYSYPEITRRLGLELPAVEDEWGRKITVNLDKFQTLFDRIENPRISLIFPHVEEGRKDYLEIAVKDEKSLVKLLFDNLSSKIGETILLYEKVPVTGLDTIELAMKRWELVEEFLSQSPILKAVKVIAGTGNCLKSLMRKEEL